MRRLNNLIADDLVDIRIWPDKECGNGNGDIRLFKYGKLVPKSAKSRAQEESVSAPNLASP